MNNCFEVQFLASAFVDIPIQLVWVGGRGSEVNFGSGYGLVL